MVRWWAGDDSCKEKLHASSLLHTAPDTAPAVRSNTAAAAACSQQTHPGPGPHTHLLLAAASTSIFSSSTVVTVSRGQPGPRCALALVWGSVGWVVVVGGRVGCSAHPINWLAPHRVTTTLGAQFSVQQTAVQQPPELARARSNPPSPQQKKSQARPPPPLPTLSRCAVTLPMLRRSVILARQCGNSTLR